MDRGRRLVEQEADCMMSSKGGMVIKASDAGEQAVRDKEKV